MANDEKTKDSIATKIEDKAKQHPQLAYAGAIGGTAGLTRFITAKHRGKSIGHAAVSGAGAAVGTPLQYGAGYAAGRYIPEAALLGAGGLATKSTLDFVKALRDTKSIGLATKHGFKIPLALAPTMTGVVAGTIDRHKQNEIQPDIAPDQLKDVSRTGAFLLKHPEVASLAGVGTGIAASLAIRPSPMGAVYGGIGGASLGLIANDILRKHLNSKYRRDAMKTAADKTDNRLQPRTIQLLINRRMGSTHNEVLKSTGKTKMVIEPKEDKK